LSEATDNDAGVSETHDTNTDSDPGTGADIVVQLMPFADTPNPGGVYKAWVIPLGRYLDNGGDLVNQTVAKCAGNNGRPVRNPGACNKPGQQLWASTEILVSDRRGTR